MDNASDKKKDGWGGTRVNAGRKTNGDLKTKQFKLPARTVAWLEKHPNQTKAIIEIVDEKIRNKND